MRIIPPASAAAQRRSPRARSKPLRRQDVAAVYEAEGPTIYSYCLRLLRNREDAEDATSETFLRAMRAWRGPGVPNRSWLLTVAHNLAIDRIRLRRRTVRWDPAFDGPSAVDASATETFSILDSVSPEVRSMILLRVIGGLTSAEIAGIVGKRPGAVKMAIFRGFQTMRSRQKEDENALRYSE